MELHATPTSKHVQTSEPDLQNPNNGQTLNPNDSQLFTEDFDSTCSTPYVSAPSSPGRSELINGGFYYSCPASPMHFAITTKPTSFSASTVTSPDRNEFEFSARFGSAGSGQQGSMSSADELFFNGQIRPIKLSTHLEKPQVLAPLLDLENEEDEQEEESEARIVNGSGESNTRGRDFRLRDKSLRRKTRSLSPLRRTSFGFEIEKEGNNNNQKNNNEDSLEVNNNQQGDFQIEEMTTPSVSATSSRSSSAGRNSKRWVFLKEFLYRSKSEGRSNNKFWSNISFSSAKEKKVSTPLPAPPQPLQVPTCSKENFSGNNVPIENQRGKGAGQASSGKKPVNGVGKRRGPAASPHELHYKASRAQAEEMRKKTFLPYRQGLLGCLGFSSKGYGAMNGFARALNPVSSK